jgi:hypothetical protein
MRIHLRANRQHKGLTRTASKKGTLPPWFCLAANTQAAKLFAASEKERQPCCTGL